MNYLILSPEILVCVLGIIILFGDIIIPAHRKEILGITAAIGLLPVFPVLLGIGAVTGYAVFPGFAFDPFSTFFKLIILLATIVVILLSVNYSGLPAPRKGPYYSLIIFSCAAMMFLVSATDLLMIYLAIEFLG